MSQLLRRFSNRRQYFFFRHCFFSKGKVLFQIKKPPGLGGSILKFWVFLFPTSGVLFLRSWKKAFFFLKRGRRRPRLRCMVQKFVDRSRPRLRRAFTFLICMVESMLADK